MMGVLLIHVVIPDQAASFNWQRAEEKPAPQYTPNSYWTRAAFALTVQIRACGNGPILATKNIHKGKQVIFRHEVIQGMVTTQSSSAACECVKPFQL